MEGVVMVDKVVLPSGRTVIDTGKVQIGLRHGEVDDRTRVVDWTAGREELSADAELIQSLLLQKKPGSARIIETDRRWLSRLVRWAQGWMNGLRQ
jgi:hypothetical protein